MKDSAPKFSPARGCLGHEVDSAEDEQGLGRLRGLTGKPKRVPDEIRDVLYFRPLVVVGEDQRVAPSCQRFYFVLKPSGKVLTPSGVTDGPFAEGKEIVGGFMILAAPDYEGAVAVVKAMPGMQMPGACVEIREMASS